MTSIGKLVVIYGMNLCLKYSRKYQSMKCYYKIGTMISLTLHRTIISSRPVNDVDHTKTKAASPQTNGICERFHKTILEEFYQIIFRKKLYTTMEELQKDLDIWIESYNNNRTHQGKMCCGRTPMATLLDGKSIWAEKNLAQI